MSELKFRAWDEIEGFVYSEDLWLSEFFRFVGEESVEQWIGIAALNGKDIYEGDIVKFAQCDDFWLDDDDEEKKKFFDDAQISVVGEYGKIKGEFGDFGMWLIAWAMEDEWEFEIIGNIHENPELLRQKGGK